MTTLIPRRLLWMTGANAVVLFLLSSQRHWGLRSTAWDLGFFDQALYLISQGATPIVSIAGFHVMGDHASWIVYPLALLYWITPNVHWLFGLQALALSSGAIPLWLLMKRDQVPESTATAVVIAYFLYPSLFEANLFDFHPEVLAVPALFGAILAARSGRTGWFLTCILIVTGCKDACALPIAGLGLWLLLFEARTQARELRRRILIMGTMAIIVGVAWLFVSTQLIIPAFHGPNPARGRYDYLGESFGGIVSSLWQRPRVVFDHLFTWPNAEYFARLFLPIGWALSVRRLGPFIAAVPMLLVNMLSTIAYQRGLQYSIPIVPFFFVAGAATVAAARGWRRHPALIGVWALIAFVSLINLQGVYIGVYRPERLESRRRVEAALRLITTDGGVLTTNDIAPHVTHRPIVKLAIRTFDPGSIKEVDYVLLNVKFPGLFSSPKFAADLVAQLQRDPDFCQRYMLGDVHLFERRTGGCVGGVGKR